MNIGDVRILRYCNFIYSLKLKCLFEEVKLKHQPSLGFFLPPPNQFEFEPAAYEFQKFQSQLKPPSYQYLKFQNSTNLE
ncbi:hypothetical protein VNO80_21335 [Phaseolus coccineus]|uniref:Uncharacterized protein n=1 Tax=Phaseolus coccineus TaxID=3886 RepID=A0AAN9M2X4_PHACN